MSDVVATKIVLRGRKVVGGCAEGEAIVTRDTMIGVALPTADWDASKAPSAGGGR